MDEEIEPKVADQDSEPGAAAPVAAPRPVAPAPSGLPTVDSAVEQLDALDQLPVHNHVEVFDDVQRRLHDALAELDDEQ